MKIVVTGGRDFHDHEALWRVLSELKPTVVIHGGARGADTLAGEWAEWAGVPTIVCDAPWTLVGPIAGHIRNLRMLDLHPDLVVACPGGTGTRHCVTNALLRGIPVRRVA